MSNPMNPIGAAPSFFPTAKELSSGLQWFRDHPVLAAAAATAVSAITYWSTTEVRMYEPEAERSGVSLSNSSSGALARKSSSSEGKLSNSVSWSDEHGGSLTEVFEEMGMEDHTETSNSSERRTNSEDSEEGGLQIIDIEVAKRRMTGGGKKTTKYSRKKHLEEDEEERDETDEDGEESERRDKVPAHFIDGLPPRKKNTTTNRMKRSGLESPLTTRIKEDGVSAAEFEIHSESPQWGWYVAITPPQDPELPRAMHPTMKQHQTMGISSTGSSNTGGGSLRRSTSGRIQK